ncbi:ribosomal L7Ae/L30e/S12e/Gadd45 family protein [Paenibacillus thermoaerophilus]|uniref:Ribosomal L7Ae/L30e/S12e/Gadd45 family protein n=1 Tax=Paenibacillus thermoaerophilus TaxID=1215385 RepID=A0ABW2V4W6_9BACL|nr:ribosomal L7Ae/L30e/S12e/Gadd45 family protein [Paenibacillus thermoaerophilus]TMV10972.1 50S ribosomal protein L7ae-like protein [Paenibacillus thermoaerophilus]
MLEHLKQAAQLSIGTKQTTKVVEEGKASEVFIAKDADPRLTSKIVSLCKKTGIPIVYAESMKQLGRACGIDVGAAMAAIVKTEP